MEINKALAIIDAALGSERLSDLQELVLVGTWQSQTYADIAEQYGYDGDYTREIGAQLWQLLSEALGERITKRNCHSVLGRLNRLSEEPIHELVKSSTQVIIGQDWGEAPDSSLFLGRKQELDMLQSWMIEQGCRLIGVFGMGGTGKTALSTYLAQQLQGSFDYVLWRSLRNAPSLNHLLADFIQFLSGKQETEKSLPCDSRDRITLLIHYLKQHRCLLVLDNAESILKLGAHCGLYRPGYEDYGVLLKQVGEQSHQSCLLLTSREKPLEFSQLEGTQLPIRSLKLTGLQRETGKRLVQQKGQFSATTEAWQRLVSLYSGNPLALQIVAAAIKDLFDGNVDRFIDHSVIIFDDINLLLDEQFNRLSALEKQIMYWLAIEREPIEIEALEANILRSFSKRQLFEALKSLVRRSLVYKAGAGFTQQPVVMEYLIEKLQQQVTQEIISDTPDVLISYALVKSQTKEYIRESQQRILLEPIKQGLLSYFENKAELENKLKQIIDLLRNNWANESGYAAGNILNLMQKLGLDISGCDFSQLSIRQVDVQNTPLKGVNFTGVQLDDAIFSYDFDYSLSVAIAPQGNLLATGGAQGGITLWNFPEMDSYQLLSGHSHWVKKLTFSADGRLLASAGFDRTVRVWDVQTAECLATLKGHTAPASSACFSPDGENRNLGGS